MKKKITHVLYSGLGGHANVFFSLFDSDRDHDFEYEVAFCGIEELLDEYRELCEEKKIRYQYFKKISGVDFRIYKNLTNFLLKQKPDIIFLHGASFIIPAIFAKVFRRSTKIIVRDTQAHHLKTSVEWFWLRISTLVSKKIVFLTEESKRVVENKYKFFPLENKSVVIPNGIDMEIYHPVDKPMSEREFIIGMQSRLQSIKDHSTLIRAFKVVCDELPEHHIKLRIAGDGETKDRLQELVNQLQLNDQVWFSGFLSKQPLIAFMQSLDIYVHASFGETMSNSIMQAMAVGLPIIASDVWGINNMIKHTQNGILYSSGNVQALSKELLLLLANEEIRTRLGRAAREYAVEHFSSHSMFLSYKEVFTE